MQAIACGVVCFGCAAHRRESLHPGGCRTAAGRQPWNRIIRRQPELAGDPAATSLVDLRPYLVNDRPAAPLTLNDEQTTLEFAGLDFAIYNLQLDA